MKIRGILIANAAAMVWAAPLAAQTRALDKIEAQFDAGVSSADQMAWLKDMSSAPNHLGSSHNKANAEMQLALFRQWGWDARIETFHALYATPISTTVELITPDRILLGGQEPAIAADASSSELADALPPYVVYQGDGDVTGDVVYVNYGMLEDYKALARAGIDVKGKIVLARYGAGLRGLKPKLAQDHGAIGCIIFSDPADDGYARGDVYPRGGMRPDGSVQRGSVVNLPIYAGDPLTPGIGATENAKRIAREDAPTILKIPTLPMSYGDAAKILSRLGGRLAPADWRGALPLAYHIGGNDSVKLRLAVKSDWKLTPVYNVIATIKGRIYPDEWIIRGNHRDAWVFGASDPLSGQVALMAEGKAIGGLLKQGWRPKRTIVYASWDGEEAALLGSTEWAEQHAGELKAKGLLYINTDNPARGILKVDGSPAFQHLVNQAAGDVTDPATGASLLARQLAAARVSAGAKPDASVPATEQASEMPLGPLGSGSDYTAFTQFLGIASLHVGFEGEGQNRGVYHSAYDSYHHFVTFDDPGLRYGSTLSKMVGRLVLRAADSETPPMRFSAFADAIGRYVRDLDRYQAERQKSDVRTRDLVKTGAYQLANNPDYPLADPIVEPIAPLVSLAQLNDALDQLRGSASAFDAAYARWGGQLAPARRAELNGLLRSIEQLLLDERGLPGRGWYRNMISAPGLFTGYAAKTLPGVREAIEERRFSEAETYVARTASVLQSYASRLDQARIVLEKR